MIDQGTMTTLLQLTDQLSLQTRKKQDIQNVLDRRPLLAGAQFESDDYKKKFKGAKHRPGPPCRTYNCHGLTFAARRTAIDAPAEVQKILSDDEYEDVARSDVHEGDIVLYYRDGDIEHSGIVVGFKTSIQGIQGASMNPLILSKWGASHEVIHAIYDSPYEASDVRFYRLVR